MDPGLLSDAEALHRDALVVDLHNDVLITMRATGLRLERRHRFHLPNHFGFWHTDLPRMIAGGMTGQFFGLVSLSVPERGCYRRVHTEIRRLQHAVARTDGRMRMARTAADLRAAHRDGHIAAFMGAEGAHHLEGDPSRVHDLTRAGVRYLGLAHFSGNRFAPAAKGPGSDNHGPLPGPGHELIAEMNRCGMIVDLAHVGRQAFLDATRLAAGPVIVSHTGICGVLDLWRNLTDEQVRAVADTDGAIGIIFTGNFLAPPGSRNVAAVVDHMEHVRNLVGARHVALGSDFDGLIMPVEGLEDVSCLGNITAELMRRGWAEQEIRGVLGENAARVLQAHDARLGEG